MNLGNHLQLFRLPEEHLLAADGRPRGIALPPADTFLGGVMHPQSADQS